MKKQLITFIENALKRACEDLGISKDQSPQVGIEEPNHKIHGDFSTNIAMMSAKLFKMSPRKVAEILKSHLDNQIDWIEKIDIAGPGFINFFIKPTAWYPVLHDIHQKNNDYGRCDIGKDKIVQVEFVSANPTGPLHVGHGRGAAVGDIIGNILSFCGYKVIKEYYINDSGRQIKTLGRSVYLRMLDLLGRTVDFPEDCYQGDYILDIAKDILQSKGKELGEWDTEKAIVYCSRVAADVILDGIRTDLRQFGVIHDTWFSEQTLYDEGKVDAAIISFKNKGIVYEHDGALWFKTTDYGDEKDRVVVRANGLTTYFASDIAYHKDKVDRGLDWIIDIWGADHHGYVERIQSVMKALDVDIQRLDIILIQLVSLLRNGEPVAMSTRSGEFVTLKQVIDEVGTDAARFIFLTRHYDSHLDFDLELAKKQTNDNPVYYVQYVHARISSILTKAEAEKGITTIQPSDSGLERLTAAEEIDLMKRLVEFPELIKLSAQMKEPHRITFFLMDVASLFHAYYNQHRILSDDIELTHARLYLVSAIRTVIRNGLTLLGVSSPHKM
ncbi:MAG: arginine--tRNA ligase [Desulfobacterales bacterium]|nr:arginine--tRNA ligase [Desulfobacterales bacterium]